MISKQLTMQLASEFLRSMLVNPSVNIAEPDLPALAMQHAVNLQMQISDSIVDGSEEPQTPPVRKLQ